MQGSSFKIHNVGIEGNYIRQRPAQAQSLLPDVLSRDLKGIKINQNKYI
jgi:hypothetical protein